MGPPFTANLLFYNNVCYGAASTAVTVEGGNVTVTGNVLIATGPVADDPGGAYLYYPQPDVTFSGNYVEGPYDGLTILNSDDTPVPGMAITHNTIAGGSRDATFEDGLPGVMDGNQWGGGLAVFSVLGQSDDYPGFLAWANANGFEEQSAGTVMPLIDGSTYDEQLDADPTLAQVMSLFRTYATAQINSYPASAAGATASEIDGTTTLGADGTAPQAADPTYDFSAGTPLNVAAAQGLLAGSSDAGGEPLVAALAANPAHGARDGQRGWFVRLHPQPRLRGRRQLRLRGQRRQRRHGRGHRHAVGPAAPTGGFQVTAVAELAVRPADRGHLRLPQRAGRRFHCHHHLGRRKYEPRHNYRGRQRGLHRQRQQHLRRGRLLHDRRDDRRRERGDTVDHQHGHRGRCAADDPCGRDIGWGRHGLQWRSGHLHGYRRGRAPRRLHGHH